ncbi:MAG: bifunctional transcriptional activator/DNA repair enzyme AdaA [Acidimicrobiales bacterium]
MSNRMSNGMSDGMSDRMSDRMSDGNDSNLDNARWEAVERRDADHEGVFFYGVRTTGIYCVPACPSRRPRRANVEFFATAADAVAAGFRGCRRCRPDQATVTDPAIASVVAVCRRIENPDDDPSIAELASSVGWSQRHLARLFKRVTGVTISAYRRAQRSERVRDALRRGTPVTEAVFEAGYGSMRAFYDHAAIQLGSAPAAYRLGSPGTVVGFTTIATPLGVIGVAATERGVCAVRIGDDPDAVAADIVAEFPQAVVERDDAGLAEIAVAIGELAGGRPSPMADIPLDVQGTAFQVSVWEALRSIEPGTVATYGEIAAKLGRPGSQRAVAGACAANPTALVVPCHRVVRADGTTGGYRWGPERKSALLAAESTSVNRPSR